MAQIEVQNVTKAFGERRVLKGVSFAVKPGQCLLLSGPSGSGKTTLLRIVAGLETPDSGRVLIDDREVTSGGVLVPPHERKIGFVFQDLALWPHLRAAQHLDLVLRGRGLSRRQRRARVESVLDICALKTLSCAYPASLSGGEAQRLAIARALAASPRILLMDEPFAHLDARLRQRIKTEMTHLKNECEVALILATHNLEDATGFSDSVTTLEPCNGRGERAVEPDRRT